MNLIRTRAGNTIFWEGTRIPQSRPAYFFLRLAHIIYGIARGIDGLDKLPK